MNAGTKIAVAGGTGRVGGHLVELLEQAGHDVVTISRSTGVDVITGEGLDAALEGVDVIVDAATGPSSEQEPATEFFTTAARNLIDAGRRAGVQRIVVVSIIGCDRFAGGYNAAKVAHEQALLAGPIPVRIVRAAQFHEFVEPLMSWSTQGDVCHLPDMATQIVAARSVAEQLAAVALAPDAPDVSEVAGPQTESLVALARLLAERRGDGVRVEAVTDPADPDTRLMAQGGLLPSPGATLTGPTFEEWLDATVPVTPAR
jgi:uncharacterized protein YbjT (DUF2867 family)